MRRNPPSEIRINTPFGGQPIVLRRIEASKDKFESWTPSVLISEPSGSYWEPLPAGLRHQRLSGFYLADVPVTLGQLGNMPRKYPNLSISKEINGRYHFSPDFPVENITLAEIQGFCQATGLRLPTLHEWEWAANGTGTTMFAGSKQPNEVGWYEENSGGNPQAVRQKKSNDFGLFDMSGSVFELTSTTLNGSPLIKGGAYNRPLRFASVDFTASLTLSKDHWCNVGFRPALSL